MLLTDIRKVMYDKYNNSIYDHLLGGDDEGV